ncbi:MULTISPECIES: DNA cytosine methyltransferase [Sphingomonas]|uniref:Cytosine-specific methyltransferase n=1 Tax=Sphingomonas molluscorum TaxID=418184 RepID=A0ABU8Q3L2_9SPHN|nr:DNA cytosine methyltransferase [Sphingomonas sp. JUb134]MBM7405100.1 DNA (cytosine-5)-methyltransferase 1 [Sphingomonas sp. JUb134]
MPRGDFGPILACDLFAGAGGFSLGARNAGIHVAAAVEVNRHAAATYRRNLIDSDQAKVRLYEEDIAALDPERVRKEAGFDASGCDILMGGPPCQGFSTHRINGAGVGDPRNALLLRYFRFVESLRPAFFLVENVPGLLWPRHRSFLSAFYDLGQASDYEMLPPVVLNAKDFGVPQNRRRVFILGVDRRRARAPLQWPPSATHVPPDRVDDERPRWRVAAEAFASAALDGDPNDIHMKHGSALVDAFKATPPNGGSRRDSGRILNCHVGHSGHSDVYGRINPEEPGPTMTTACVNPSKGRFVHPTLHHGITLRQAARLQTFPDWFVFEGGLMAGGVQVGNAVPVDMAAALLRPLKDAALAIRAAEKPHFPSTMLRWEK